MTTLKLPADKSITHRYLFMAAICEGESILRFADNCSGLPQDCLTTIRVLRQFGVAVTVEKEPELKVTIQSRGYQEWSRPSKPVQLGNSGTTARHILGLVAAHRSLCPVSFIGDESLSNRPMTRLLKILEKFSCRYIHQQNKLPITIKVPLTNLPNIVTTEIKSAQLKSTLLLILSTKNGGEINVPPDTRNHTEKLLEKFCHIEVSSVGNNEKITIANIQPKPFEVKIPCDPSALIFPLLLLVKKTAKKRMKIENVLLNKGRVSYFDHLKSCGFQVEVKANEAKEFCEKSGSILIAETNHRYAMKVDRQNISKIIDEIPMLVVWNALTNNHNAYFYGVEELALKESNRIMTSIKLGQACGAKCFVDDNNLIVEPGKIDFDLSALEELSTSCTDHRVIMAAEVARRWIDVNSSFFLENKHVSVSFPRFYEQIKLIRNHA